ncbi:MAG: ABC transporter substrate-binding protein, partial [Halobacteriaceae archaeon]
MAQTGSSQSQRSGETPEEGKTGRRRFLRYIGVTGTAWGAGCLGRGKTIGGSTKAPDEIVIGSIHPFTGPTSYQGQRLHNAMKLAATVKNENGGIQSLQGAKVRLLKGDHKNKPSVGAEVAKELIDQGAAILTGTYASSVANAVTQVAESKGIPFVMDVAANPTILQDTQLKYSYR